MENFHTFFASQSFYPLVLDKRQRNNTAYDRIAATIWVRVSLITAPALSALSALPALSALYKPVPEPYRRYTSTLSTLSALYKSPTGAIGTIPEPYRRYTRALPANN